MLKSIYGDLCYFFGVYSPKNFRVDNLKRKGLTEKEIYSLIMEDSGQEMDYGQSVEETFMLADFFVRIDNNVRKLLESKLRRFLHLIFDTDIVTPYVEETAMYHAASAAGNSGCLSKQVGACITDSNGEILSIGWNDVPKFTGGVYKSDKIQLEDKNDHRCKCLDPKICFNDEHKKKILKDLEERIAARFSDFLKKTKFHLATKLGDGYNESLMKEIRKIASIEFSSKIVEEISKCGIKKLIEFSRSIHAEMHAIIIGSQKSGSKMIGGKLFCTTFPCHNCARHIVLSGIEEVYYIEPYPKSLAEKLHFDSIASNEPFENRVKIRMYDGVAPTRYLNLFRMYVDNRKLNPISSCDAKPKYQVTLENLQALESLTTRDLPDELIYF